MLLFLFLLLMEDEIDASRWEKPIISGGKPLLTEDRLYIPDKGDKNVKVYDLKRGLDQPIWLWSTPGPGQGPGEHAHGQFQSLAVDKQRGHLWVSHYGGFQVYRLDNGAHVTDYKVHGNKAAMLVHRDRLVLGPRSSIVHQKKALRFFDISAFHPKAPEAVIENPRGVPILTNGDFLVTQPELFLLGERVIRYDFSLAEIMTSTLDGKITGVTQLPYAHHPKVEIESYRYWTKEITEITNTGYFHALSGLAAAGQNKLWLALQSYSPKKENFQRFLIQYNLASERIEARYQLPGFDNFCIVGVRKEGLVVFDLEGGQRFGIFQPATLNKQ